MILCVITAVLAIIGWELGKATTIFHQKRTRYPNGVPRVEVNTAYNDRATVAVMDAAAPEPAICVFPGGQRVEVRGRSVKLSVPLSGASIEVEDFSGSKLWGVEMRSRDA